MNVSAVAHGYHHAAHKANASHKASNFEGVLHGQNVRTGTTAKKDETQRGMGGKIGGEDWQALRANFLGKSSKSEQACRRGLYGVAVTDNAETQTSQTSQTSKFDFSEYNGLLDINRVDSRAANYIYGKTFNFILDALSSREVAEKLSNMIINCEDADLATRAADREAARDLAQYIADSYFDDPEEAQAFMEEINKRIEDSELIDKGYVLSDRAYLRDNYEFQLVKPTHPPSDKEIWLKKNGLTGFTAADLEKFEEERGAILAKRYQEENIYYTSRGSLDLNSGGRVTDGWVLINLEVMEHPEDFSNPHPWELIAQNAYEYEKISRCGPCGSSMYRDEARAWYAEHESNAKEIAAQEAIDKAKKITDFSSNEKWNDIMRLLSKAA